MLFGMDEWTKPLESGRKTKSVFICKKILLFFIFKHVCYFHTSTSQQILFPLICVFINQSRYHVIMPRRCKNSIRLSASSFSDFDYRYFNSLCMGLSSYSFGHLTHRMWMYVRHLGRHICKVELVSKSWTLTLM